MVNLYLKTKKERLERNFANICALANELLELYELELKIIVLYLKILNNYNDILTPEELQKIKNENVSKKNRIKGHINTLKSIDFILFEADTRTFFINFDNIDKEIEKDRLSFKNMLTE